MSRALPIIFIMITTLASCLNSKDLGSNLLNYDLSKNYTITSAIISYTSGTLYQSVYYFNPKHPSDELMFALGLTFSDTLAAIRKKTLDLSIDTNIVQAIGLKNAFFYDIQIDSTVTGQIEILNWEPGRITLNEKIVVNFDDSTQTKVFEGKRTFTYQEGY